MIYCIRYAIIIEIYMPGFCGVCTYGFGLFEIIIRLCIIRISVS